MKAVNLGILRHALTFGGGILVAKGLADSAQVGQVVSDIITAAGAIISVAGVAGSIWQKFQQQRALQAAQSTATPLPFSMEKAS